MSLFNPGPLRITDENNRPISGGRAFFYRSGTTTPVAVYADDDLTVPHTNPVVADAAGLLPAIFLDDAVAYRVLFTDAAGDTSYPLYSADPINSNNALGSPIDTVSATSYVVLASDANRIKKRTASGAMTDTLPTAASVGNGFRVTFWNATAAQTDTISVTGGGTINGSSSLVLQPGQWVTLVSDGTSWAAPGASLPVGWREYPIEGGGLIPRTTNGAAYAKIETTTNKRNFDIYLFDATTQEYVDFTLPLPASYDGGAIRAIVEWSDTGATTGQTVTFGVAGRCLADGDAIDQALGTTAEQSDALDAPGDIHKTAAFSFTPANAGAGRLLTGTLYRKASTGTITGDVRVLALRLLVNLTGAADA